MKDLLNFFDKPKDPISVEAVSIKMASPDYVLKRGYSLTLKDGKIIKQADGLVVGDELITCFADGEVRSKVLKK